MSWLVEIAGNMQEKAEIFLNNIDKAASETLSSSGPDELGLGVRRNSKTWKSQDSDNVSSMYLTVGQQQQQVENSTDTSISISNQDKTSNGPAAQQQSFNKNFTTPSGRSRPRSKPTTKQEESAVVQDSGSNINTAKSKSKILANGSSTNSSSSSSNNNRTDEELLDFLNSPNQREIDEISLLKSEIQTQARETGLILKNHKKLQQDYETQGKHLEELQNKLVNSDNQGLDSKSAENLHNQVKQLNAQIKAKDEETVLLRERLDEALEKLKSMDKLANIKNRVEQLELENRQTTIKNTELEEKVQNLTSQSSTSAKQIQSARDSLVAVEKEFGIYKEKAKAILRTKDELIASIKDEKGRSPLDGGSVMTDNQIMSECASLRNERELLHGEISQSRLFCDSLKEDNHRLESEIHTCRITILELQETLAQERDNNHTIQEEHLQLSQNLSSVQLQLEREKSDKRKLEERLKKFTNENEFTNLSTVTVTRSASGSPNEFSNSQVQSSSSRMNLNQSPVPLLSSINNNGSSDIPDERDNLKTRIKALTQSLLEKQGLINSISADKQLLQIAQSSLQIRVERLQAQIQEIAESTESTSNSGLTQTVISSQPLYLSASPWDSNVATRVKRVYSRVDSLCCQFGLAMRHRPTLRLGFSVYILFLHLWVFFILFYWSHSTTIAHPYIK